MQSTDNENSDQSVGHSCQNVHFLMMQLTCHLFFGVFLAHLSSAQDELL